MENKSDIKRKIKTNNIEFVFKILYLFLVLLSFCSLTSGTFWIKMYAVLIAILGSILLFWRIIHYKNYTKTPGLWILALFITSYIVSMIINSQYGIMENIQGLLWLLLQFGILFAYPTEIERERIFKDYQLLSFIYIGYIFICNSIGIIMFLMNKGYNFNEGPNGNRMGFLWGRLWGVYTDPNYGAVLVAVAIIFCMYWIEESLNKIIKIYMTINIVLGYMYILLSDSRTGIVCVWVGVMIYAFIRMNNLKKNIDFKKVALNIVCAVLISLFPLFLGTGVKNAYNSHLLSNPAKTESEIDAETELIGRDNAETENDISNRRFSLWKSGLEIWKESPIVGVSRRNITLFAKDRLPETYMVNNDYTDFDSTHNMFIDILVSQGIIGFCIIILFFIKLGVIIIKELFIYNKKSVKGCPLLFSVLVILSVSCIFVPELIYLNSGGAIIFWCSLGCLLKVIGK